MTAETPMVSVIVPVYNVRHYLKACVRSLQAQTEPNIEIILVDDGSTDGSGELCDRLAAGDSRIVVCHQTNGGVSAARNEGLGLAKGKYIMFCDSDDTVLPRYCQAHLEAMSQPGVALTMASTSALPPETEALADEAGRCRLHYAQLMNLWQGGWLSSCCGKCFDRQVVDRLGMTFRQDLTFGEDNVFVLDYIRGLLDHPGQICVWREHLYCYYSTPGSLSKSERDKREFFQYRVTLVDQFIRDLGLESNKLGDYWERDLLSLKHTEFREGLERLRWYQIRDGFRYVKEAMSQPALQEHVEELQRLGHYNRRYWKLIRDARPLPMYLYLTLRRMAKQAAAQPAVRLFFRRKRLQ